MSTQNADRLPRQSIDIDKSVGASRRHARSSRSNTRKIALLRVALAVTIALAFVAGLAGMVYTQGLSRENDKLYFTVRKQEKELSEAKVLIEELTSMRDSLVEGRIPGLREVAYDKTFEFDTGYVRNIIFTLTRVNGKTKYEFKAVLANQTTDFIQPRVQLRLYDALGTQVGGADIGAVLSTDTFNPTEANKDLLRPDEIRSYSGNIDLSGEAILKYFAVVAQ